MSFVNTQPVLVNYRYSVPAEMVFDAWLKPEIVRRWMFKSNSNEILTSEIDARVGGRFSILKRKEMEEILHFGRYITIIRPGLLVFSLEVPKYFNGVSCVTIEILQRTTGCELLLTHTGVDPQKTELSWRIMLGKLAEVLKD